VHAKAAGYTHMASRRDFLLSAAATAVPVPASRGRAQAVALRTHEWFGDKLEQFSFPSGWRIDVRQMNGWRTPALSSADINRAIRNPVGTRPLRDIAAGKRTVTIAVDDLTRPTPVNEIVPHVLEELQAAGIRDENILFVMGHGTHRQVDSIEVAKKLGPGVAARYPWINHNVWDNQVDLGTTKSGNRVLINCYYYRADVRITISGVKRHSAAGYAGGPKMILPGVSGFPSIRHFHDRARMRETRPRVDPDGREIIRMWDNEARQDMIEAARRAEVAFSVQVVYNQERRPVHVVAGDIVAAHHQAARYAVNHLATEYASNADVIVVNGYPKAAQVHEQFGWGARGLKDGGSIVIINQLPGGEYVWHYLVEAWRNEENETASYFELRAARKRRFPQARQVLFYSQYLQQRELDHLSFPPEAVGCRSWADVVARLEREHKGDVNVAVYPYAGLQHGVATLDLPDNV